MAERTTSLIKRHLTPQAQVVALNLLKRMGKIRIVLSAGVIALSKLSADEREKVIDEANAEPLPDQSDPEHLLESLREILQSENENKTMFTSADVAKIITEFRKKMSPETKENLKHKNA